MRPPENVYGITPTNSIPSWAHLCPFWVEEKRLHRMTMRAEMAGVPQSHISNIENGKVNVRLSSLIEIARILELEPMLIPRRYVPAVKGFMETKKHGKSFHPAATLDEEDNDD